MQSTCTKSCEALTDFKCGAVTGWDLCNKSVHEMSFIQDNPWKTLRWLWNMLEEDSAQDSTVWVNGWHHRSYIHLLHCRCFQQRNRDSDQIHLHVTECCVKGKNQVFTQRRSMLQIWSSLINDWEPEQNLKCFTFEDLIFVSNFTGSLNFLIISTLTRKYETLSTWSQMSGLCCSWS